MSEYLGYRVIVNGITIPDRMMIRGSYGTTPTKRIVSSWVDANLIDHDDESDNPKHDIVFTLRRRKLADQEELLGAFESLKNIMVTFWNDRTCTYRTGRFKMDPPQFLSYVEKDELWYKETAIHLMEY